MFKKITVTPLPTSCIMTCAKEQAESLHKGTLDLKYIEHFGKLDW